jgi:hypothetical protein
MFNISDFIAYIATTRFGNEHIHCTKTCCVETLEALRMRVDLWP